MDSVTVTAGERYRASAVQEWLLGPGYRPLWTETVEVAVLDPERFAGGLTVLREGGGLSSRTLHLKGADGRRYVFRSVDKDVTRGLRPELRGTLVHDIVQDQVAAKHPGAALSVPPLLKAAEVLHVVPLLRVMPDHPFLGEHRERYAGMLGTVEERPDEGDEEGDPSFAGAVRVAGTERLLEHLRESPLSRVDAPAYLRARLMDILVGDWDRHADQWRWARFDSAGVRRWEPVPRDRDNAMVRHGGFLIGLARAALPRLVEFDRSPDVFGLTVQAVPLDRQVLSELPRETWEREAEALRAALTDEVIDRAVAEQPAEYRVLGGERLRRVLRARRDRLPELARRFYRQLSTEVDVHATDAAERAHVDRLPDGSVEVRLYALEGPRAGAPYFLRRFRPEETNEVRVHLHGGDDRAVVRGSASRSLTVRVIGGEGDDVLADSSRAGGGSYTGLYDAEGDNRFVRAAGTRVDRRPFQVVVDTTQASDDLLGRDWGRSRTSFAPWAEWRSNVGAVVGGGPRWTRYGFRRLPHASEVSLRGLYAPGSGRFGVEVRADARPVNRPVTLELTAAASDVEASRFHGFGNDSPGGGDTRLYRILERELRAEILVRRELGKRGSLFAGPLVRRTAPEIPAGSPAAGMRPRGSEPIGRAGVRAGAALDVRDAPAAPGRGATLLAEVTAHPAAWGAAGAYGRVSALATGYVPLGRALRPVLALRAGAERAWGAYPFQDAASIGGSGSLRGYAAERFTGDAALYGTTELRARLGEANLGIRWDVDGFLFTDAGRIVHEGASPGGWHRAYGGGLSLSSMGRAVSVAYARGEEHRLHFRLGPPF